MGDRTKGEDMRRFTPVAFVALVSILGPGMARSTPGQLRPAGKPEHLEEASVIVELNATAGDAGFQVFLDNEPWSTLNIFGPDGRRVISFDTHAQVKDWGLTELFTESSEPSFQEFPLKKFKKLFPEGTYRFRGMTVEGKRLVGKATLSHAFPDGPQITSPAEGSTVSPDNLVVQWNPVSETGGIDVVGYRAIVERENPFRSFSVDLPPNATSVTVPNEYMEAGTKYKLEIQVIEASGNLTIAEREFSTS
jgi:hypothetical protein